MVWLLIPLGIALIVWSTEIGNTIGEIELAEQFLGGGGTYDALKLIGALLIVGGFVWGVNGFPGSETNAQWSVSDVSGL